MISLRKACSLSPAVILATLLVFLTGCSTGQAKPSENQHGTGYKPDSYVDMETYQTFVEHNPMISSRIGETELIVRMATTTDAAQGAQDDFLYLLPAGAGSLGLGLVAAPMFASSLIAGGVLLMPLAVFGYSHEKHIWDSINGALSNTEFTRAIDSAMKQRLSGVLAAQHKKIEIVIITLGLVKVSGMQHCLIISADLMLSGDNMIARREHMQISDSNRSADAPPPQCASPERFSSDDARLVKDTIAEYAEVLSAMVAARLSEGATK
jgi:hypothetical protein